jgi:hypothetical protein
VERAVVGLSAEGRAIYKARRTYSKSTFAFCSKKKAMKTDFQYTHPLKNSV